MTDLIVNPVAMLFPMLPKEELRELADDIQRNGLQQPIVMQNGVVLDGRNRLAACELAGVKPTFTEYTGESPVAFIIGVNLRRRHLSIGQMLKETELQHGSRGIGKSGLLPGKSTPTLKELGLSFRESAEAQLLAEMPAGDFEKIKAGTQTRTQVRRKKREANREKRRQENAKLVEKAPAPRPTPERLTAAKRRTKARQRDARARPPLPTR